MFKFHLASRLAIASLIAATGCSSSSAPAKPGASAQVAPAKPSPEGEKLILAALPENHQTVIQTREAAKNGDEVAVLGRIGGSTEPWVEGRAAFTIVDPTILACSDDPSDHCPTPWDYCCQTDKLPTSMATVKFVDESGKTIETDARKLLGLKELNRVVIKGKALRDDAGNLTVLATGVYIQPESAAAKPAHDHDHGHEHKHDHDHDHKQEPASKS